MISRCSDARIGEEKTLSASACELRAARTTPATSSRRRTSRTCSFKFNDRAALAVIVTCDAPVVGSQRAVTRESPGIMSLSTSSLFALSSGERMVSPVVFPPGRERLATTPAPRMSSLIDNRNRLCRLLGYFGLEIAGCKDDVYFQTDQLGRELGKLLGASLSVAELDGDVLTVNETQRAQALPKRLHPG